MPITTSQPADSASPFASWKVEHIALRVPSFEAAVAWYGEKLDFRLKHSLPLAGLTFGFLSPAGDDRISFELLAGPGADERPTYADLRSSYGLQGWHHVGLHVASVDAAVDELKRRGVAIVSEPHDVVSIGLRVAFFADPWGNLFELTEPLRSQG
ncbi:glyoxylase I family protein [Granulicella rosea]|uniref:Glyoxylase I family protein n=1 Tax=Granulicella rosea TaxID=474952 RepID=A0A239DFJ1_9BACT|nr:VOC family protein [Granulicella rosea]SNS31100.1 glyoxylase I family protein [Granulicella rosea]